MSTKVLERLKERFAEGIHETHETFGDATAVVARERLLEALLFLRDDAELQFNLSSTVTGVDYLGREPRFEVVYQLNSLSQHHRVRVKAGVPGDDPSIASATPLWNSALWAERETRSRRVGGRRRRRITQRASRPDAAAASPDPDETPPALL